MLLGVEMWQRFFLFFYYLNIALVKVKLERMNAVFLSFRALFIKLEDSLNLN